MNMKLGIYVGSFNPPHKGHLRVAEYLLESGIVDKVIIIPTPNYWNKNDLVDVDKRTQMLKFFENENIIIDNINNRYPYTYQVLESLKKEYKDNQLYLIIGSDNLEKFHLWKNIDKILKYKIIVLRRGNDDINKYLEKLGKENFILINDFPFINVSSTEIRNNLDNEYLDERVRCYIKKHNLYGSK